MSGLARVSVVDPAVRAALVARELWRSPADRVHAIIDAARDERLHPAILRQPAPHVCLYAEASQRVAAVAPYAVELTRDAKFTHDLLSGVFGDAWGFLARTPLELEATRRHFKRFLRARLDDGRVIIFRYYDPRVLRLYLPTCTGDELGAFFGEATDLVMESEHPDRLVTFSRRRLGFSCTCLDLAAYATADAIDEQDALGATTVVA